MKRGALALGLAALAWLLCAAAWARPGGGHSFSGPSHSSPHGHGGDGDGGFELVVLLLRLVFAYPKLAIPVLVIVVVWWVRTQRGGRLESWETPHHAHASAPRPAAARAAERTDLGALRELDPDFSRVLFEDFAYRLYASVQRARGDAAALAALAPYLAEDVRAALLRGDDPDRDGSRALGPASTVSHVVVGALRIAGVSVPVAGAAAGEAVRIELGYEANLTFSAAGADARTLYTRERWTLTRAPDARSKPPGSYERLGCPNCGAPFRASDNRRCAYCGEVVSDGRFNWMLHARRVLAEESRPPSLTANVAERGTDRPTVRASDHEARWRELVARDPAVNEAALQARINLIYRELNAAWSQRALDGVRALVSDGMFDYLQYWVQAYRAQGLENVLKDMRVRGLERAKVVSDRYFDALTVRVFASGIDFTRDVGSGQVRSGDTDHPRTYSEYWTLIRGAGVRGAARGDKNCPNCAAPLAVSMAGVCTHCNAHITAGEFDWVLSKIEQDEVYEG
jgi:predicted lipid-binding transport protein (Tim44 family)